MASIPQRRASRDDALPLPVPGRRTIWRDPSFRLRLHSGNGVARRRAVHQTALLGTTRCRSRNRDDIPFGGVLRSAFGSTQETALRGGERTPNGASRDDALPLPEAGTTYRLAGSFAPPTAPLRKRFGGKASITNAAHPGTTRCRSQPGRRAVWRGPSLRLGSTQETALRRAGEQHTNAALPGTTRCCFRRRDGMPFGEVLRSAYGSTSGNGFAQGRRAAHQRGASRDGALPLHTRDGMPFGEVLRYACGSTQETGTWR